MYNFKLGKTNLSVPCVAVGCMRISGMTEYEARAFVDTALENGTNFFDHADIYGGGESERIFGRAVSHLNRDDLIIQTKCGITRGLFDFSYEHIISSVDKSLLRLGTDYIDILLLHRPDALMEPDEVARAFDELLQAGKVRHFGVSNQNPYQISLLQKSLPMPICANQLQLSIMHAPMIQSGFNVNMFNDSATLRDGGVLDFCHLNDITVQAWSPLQHGFFEGCFIDNEKFPLLNETLRRIADKYEVSKTTIAIAWILRHPAKIQPVTGTTNLQRLADCCKAADIRLTRDEWYDIYKSAGNILP